MDSDFWKQAWKDRNIGFHQSEYNAPMLEHYKDMELNGKTVFIPLAGKSKDIIYFLDRGARVIAVELSELACQEFFKENGIDDTLLEKNKTSDFTVFKTDKLSYYLGDFFKLSKKELGHIDYYFDRACIVALPQQMRCAYFNKLETLIDKKTDIFILTFSHDGPLDLGPPFRVPEKEILNAYAKMGMDLIYKKYDTTKATKRFSDEGIKSFSRIKWKRNI